MVRFGIGLLLILVSFDLLAQSFTPDPDWRFENFNNQNHFVSREIGNLTIDKHGYIWTCSRGVQRFDGYKTVDFNSFDHSKGSLRDNYTNIITDNNGRVWVSSAGLCYYDDATGKFVYIEPDAKHHITFVNTFCLQKNYLWFVCDYGLAKLDLKSLKITFTSLTEVIDPLCLSLVNERTMLISSREKVYIYNVINDTYSASILTYNHSLIKISSVINTGKDIFVGSPHGLFILRNLKDISLVSEAAKDVEVDDLLFLPEDKEKKYLFLATDGKGIMVYNTVSKAIDFTYMHDGDNLYSLASNIVSRFYTDTKGRLWIATALGVSMLDVFNQQWKMRFLDKNNTDDQYINKIARDKHDSTKVWMSSYNQGMIMMDWQTKKVEKIFDRSAELRNVNDFVQLSKNRWLLATQRNILEWDPLSGMLLKKKLPISDSTRLVYNIRRLIMADANTCFVTTNKGLFKYDLYTRQISAASINNKTTGSGNQLQYDLLNGFYDNGMLWIASRAGLFSYDTGNQKTVIYREKGVMPDYFFFDVTNAVNGRVICAAGNGIKIFNKKTKTFKAINTIANIFNPDCESVISIKNKVWIGSEVGILNYDLDTHISARAEHETEMMQIFPGSHFSIIGGDIVFGFRNGYAWFTPGRGNISIPSDPVIEGVSVNNQPVFQHPGNQTTPGELVFSHSDNSINIAFTAFLYTDPDHINFRYRLNGAGPDWQYTEGQRSANFAQLAPGKYTFYVQSGGKNGGWNNHLATVNFMIKPPYWETWWFRTLVLSLVALGLYNLYRYKIKHILAIERIRARIASDFHDDIGSALSSISIFSEVADKQLKQQLPTEQTREIIGHISFQSRAMLDAMDDIVWAVNPQNDHFNDLAIRMREFAIPLLEAKNIRFKINMEENILSTRLRMEARKNIFLIFKESVNNIIKHADCSVMEVVVNKLNNQLELIISDNGKGFDINALHNRNGLKNMQKRAVEINGTINITSQPGSGTVTRLIVLSPKS